MRHGNVFWGIMLLLIGSLFLLQTLGFLVTVNIWGLIWPLFLIGLGLWIVMGRVFVHTADVEHVELPLEGASRARLVLKHGAGRMEIRAGAATSHLVEGDFGGGLDVRARRQGDQLVATLSVPSQNFPWFGWPSGYSLDWKMALNAEVPLSLELNTGAAEAQLDLTDLKVTELRLQTGASATEMKLPANAGFTRVSIESGAASVNVHIPQGVAARIRSRSGLATVTVDGSRFPRAGEYYQSPDYETAANRAEVEIQTGVGAVDVR